jgi:hypothetical protein
VVAALYCPLKPLHDHLHIKHDRALRDMVGRSLDSGIERAMRWVDLGSSAAPRAPPVDQRGPQSHRVKGRPTLSALGEMELELLTA